MLAWLTSRVVARRQFNNVRSVGAKAAKRADPSSFIFSPLSTTTSSLYHELFHNGTHYPPVTERVSSDG
jgi:hypothetical protein